MLNYELVRTVQVERERDVERAVRASTLRAAIAGMQADREPVRAANDKGGRGSTLLPIRLR